MAGVGIRFRPTEQELLWLVLRKVQKEEISIYTSDVLEKDLYGAEAGKEPWNVFSDVPDRMWDLYDESAGKKTCMKRVLYVLTKLSQLSTKKKERSAGCGVWHGETAPKPIMDFEGGKVMGYYRQLTYAVKSESARRGSWYMHEYSLSEQVLKEIGIQSTEYVICRIIRDDSKSSKIKDSSKTVRSSSGRKRKPGCGDEGVDHGQVKHTGTNHHQSSSPPAITTDIIHQDYSSGVVMGSTGQQEGSFQNNCHDFPNHSTTTVRESMPYSGYNQGAPEDCPGTMSEMFGYSDYQMEQAADAWWSSHQGDLTMDTTATVGDGGAVLFDADETALLKTIFAVPVQ